MKNKSGAAASLLLLLLFGLTTQARADSVRYAAAKTRKAAAPAGAPAAAPGSEDCLLVDECRQYFESARRLSESRQYNAALTAYEKAYELRASPWLLVNIGRVQQKLGRPADAIASYNRFLADADHQPVEAVEAAREYVKQAESDLAAQRDKERVAAQPSPAPAEKIEEKPVYKKWWFWVALGGATAAVATAVAVGVVVGTAGPSEPQHAAFHIAF